MLFNTANVVKSVANLKECPNLLSPKYALAYFRLNLLFCFPLTVFLTPEESDVYRKTEYRPTRPRKGRIGMIGGWRRFRKRRRIIFRKWVILKKF
jgi:hypothetical protein